MVKFVDVEDMCGWIRAQGLANMFGPMVTYLEDDFRKWETFDKTPRVASHSTYGVIELMPTSDGNKYGFKYVNGHPINTKVGKQTVTAFGVLSEVDSGYPILLSEMTVLTALRTAVTSAMAAKHLVNPNHNSLALIGTGAQSEFQAIAFREILGINQVHLYDVDPDAIAKSKQNLSELGFEANSFETSQLCVEGVDIITTCTADKTNATILTPEMVTPGQHINAIGGDCPGKTELDKGVLEMGEIFVEFEPQTRIEGDIQQLDDSHEVTELYKVINGNHVGRSSKDEITIFDSVGFAIEDFSALRYLNDNVTEDFFTDIDLIAEPQDPKNLYELIL